VLCACISLHWAVVAVSGIGCWSGIGKGQNYINAALILYCHDALQSILGLQNVSAR
jgi:hypothetical protein